MVSKVDFSAEDWAKIVRNSLSRRVRGQRRRSVWICRLVAGSIRERQGPRRSKKWSPRWGVGAGGGRRAFDIQRESASVNFGFNMRLTPIIKNYQLSWWYDGEPLKAV